MTTPKGALSLLVLALGSLACPVPAAAAATAAIPFDLNGDGYADLAIGVAYEDLGTKTDAGSVNVLYGSAEGITAAGDQAWSQDTPGVLGLAEGGCGDCGPRDHFGWVLASGDFDRDGYADLAVGVPGDRVSGSDWSGAVNVLYGSSQGLTADRDQRWSRSDLLPAPDVHFAFGASMAAGDFDGDGFSDLVIGGTEYLGGDGYAGTVSVLYGGDAGLSADGSAVLTQDMVDGTSDIQRESFGDTLAAGDVDGDGDAELVTSLSSPTCCGTRVGVLFGTSSGLTTTGAQAWSQDSPGILGVTQPDERFGAALAIGDFDGDGFGDVAATSAGEAVGTTSNAGAVNVLYGSPAGLTAAGNQLWNEDVAGVPGTADNDDQFGRALAAGDFDGDGTADLAVGVPLEAPGGAVIALYGSAGGLAVAGSQLWSQGSAGVPGTRETADRFGSALAAADYGRSGRADLAIGVRNEKLRGKHQAGFVNVLYGRSGGLAGAHAQGWSQGSAGVHGAVEAVDRFGRALSP